MNSAYLHRRTHSGAAYPALLGAVDGYRRCLTSAVRLVVPLSCALVVAGRVATAYGVLFETRAGASLRVSPGNAHGRALCSIAGTSAMVGRGVLFKFAPLAHQGSVFVTSEAMPAGTFNIPSEVHRC